ncbi:hypothetical protein AN641_06055 [Candidatus Epulonipiscioides gigas]|nr:hypothetical protein AN641_06055 [Epulopiscium sp. SCG-C07WGA-EpuloA2]
MEYVIGIDGGGTKTQVTLCTLNKDIIGGAISGPSNIFSIGVEVTRQSIVQAINESVIEKGYKLEDCKAICIGVASGSWKSVQDAITNIIIYDIGYNGKLIITNDAETALMAGTGGKEGILLIAGTGSICYGINDKGKNCRVGGWGHVFDDEGSAYYISTKILSAVLKAFDGRGAQTKLTQLVLDYYKFDNERDIVAQIYKPHVKKQHVAALAKLIEQAYNENDAIAINIIDDVVDKLFISVDTAIKKLLFSEKVIDVIINGSVIVKNKAIKLNFSNKLKEKYPLINIKPLEKDAAYGATLIAINALKNLNNV